MFLRGRKRQALALALVALLGAAAPDAADRSVARYLDQADGGDWPGYGRTYGQQHYSPLADVRAANVGRLGLAWSIDLPPENSVTQPIAIDGILYFASGLSVVHAVEAASGRELWRYDPGAAAKAGMNLRNGWGVRGISWWGGRIYTGTQDGRLIAIDGRSGKPVWSVQTLEPGMAGHVNGAPRVFGGKVLVGFAATTGPSRGYITAYDAATGRKLWRFWTTPGDPAKGFENAAMAMAAKTWSGEWWHNGGGADVWNAIAYDPEADTVFFGTGSGYPWNRRARSEDKGDNLFVSSIIAVDAKTGAYKWHYQTTPGETWDFDATMDIELADLRIGGRLRKTIIQAPKNGFFYVIDRTSGHLISAEPVTKVTWASRIDRETGRPVEVAGSRYLEKAAVISPAGMGAHNWMSMAYSPRTGLAYIPITDFEAVYKDASAGWRPPVDHSVDGALEMSAGDTVAFGTKPASKVPGRLIAWSPVTQTLAWSKPYPTFLNGGAMATGGGLVFQGSLDGHLRAFAADTGAELWNYDTRAPILATPITYRVNGVQYVTVLTGLGMGFSGYAAALLGDQIERYSIDPRTTARRVLTFAIGATRGLPPRAVPPPPPPDPDFRPDARLLGIGGVAYNKQCAYCHGSLVVGTVQAPDLRRSAVPLSGEAFAAIVKGGALVPRGMPAFPDLPDDTREAIRHYIRFAASELRTRKTSPATGTR